MGVIEHLQAEEFDENARGALKDQHLRAALSKATGLFAERRASAVSSVSEWEEMRELARGIKEHVLLNLDRYLEEFVANAERAGVHVHWARDAQEACRVVAQLAAETESRRLVKSKSMTTEEIGLNDALGREGCTPVETDLGEWIIQLAGETPSHIIVPAIHKSKQDIADLFVDKLQIEKTDDERELTAAARDILRDHFARSDLGISGVNFAIAETGSFLVLENEGNARMTTSLPKVHLAVMGIEKILPHHADLEVFLRLLPRSGTGQHLTSYQSLITGPVPTGGEGPEEVHLLLLDNGRADMLKKAVTRQSLACIRCGACLNACPVYQQVGGHAYGSVYPGPIGAVITPQLAGLEKASRLPFASSLCGACRDVCPVKIDIPKLLLHLRGEVAKSGDRPAVERTSFRLWRWLMKSPRRYRWAARLARMTPGLWSRVGPATSWRAARELRPMARRSFRDHWKGGAQ